MNTTNCSPILVNKFNPKTKSDFKKIERLDKLLVRYILIRFLEEMDKLDATKLRRHNFQSTVELVSYLKQEFPNFKSQFNQYMEEFLQKYARKQ